MKFLLKDKKKKGRKTYKNSWMSSLFLIKGQWGSDVPGLEPSEGGQPQMLPDSELDPSSVSKRIRLDWYERKILKSEINLELQ